MLRLRDEGTDSSEVPERVALPRFGVALFDDTRESGWAALPDGEAVRFRSPNDLKSDCIWVCSADGMDFSQKWGKLHHLRPSDYISKLRHIASDFGLKIGSQGKFGGIAQRACSLLSPTIHRAMVVAAQVYGWNNPVTKLTERSLADDIRVALSDIVPPPVVRQHLKAPFASAFQTYSAPNWAHSTWMADSITVILRYNRLEYAQRILATPVPEGAWSHEGQDVSSRFSCSLARALDPEFPCMVNATVEFSGKDPDIASLCAFGSQPGKRSMLRTWVSQPELRWLSRHARVHIVGMEIASSSRMLPPKIQLPEILTSDPLFSLSISAGLVAEAHWKALAMSVYKPNVEGKRLISPWAVWLRAADRAMTFELALAAHLKGFAVGHYGNGSVSVSVERTKLPALLDFAMEHDIAHPSFRPIFEEQGLVEV